MTGTYKKPQALFDVWHDHQFIDNRIRAFCGNNSRFSDAQIASVGDSCFAWAMAAPFIGPFMAPGPQPVQTFNLRSPVDARFFGVVVLFA